MRLRKLGKIETNHSPTAEWASHFMAPAAVMLNDAEIRIFYGAWDKNRISRIRYLDVSTEDPLKVIRYSSNHILDIGEDGCFDENGVFPAHAYKVDANNVYLYYTGFQLGHKIRHYNFGGLAKSTNNGQSFQRVSRAPLLDRSDEGLFVRAGQSIVSDGKSGFHCVYSAGSSWHLCNNELRPVYDVFYQHSEDGISLNRLGTKIISCDLNIEHGLGRPQITKLNGKFYVFYTRRIIKDMKYFLGCAFSEDLKTWTRADHLFNTVEFGKAGEFDNEMIYFPAAVQISKDKALLFYCGNYFGRDGLGCIEILL